MRMPGARTVILYGADAANYDGCKRAEGREAMTGLDTKKMCQMMLADVIIHY